jgi:hypothetical protein
MTIVNLRKLYLVVVSLFVLIALSPAYAAEMPSDDEQDVLIRTTLLTFNDANMTGNFSVFYAKAAKQFQDKYSAEKMAAGFETFRTKELFFEDIATAEYDSEEKAKFDEGALILAGVFKTDNMLVKYRLRFVQNAKVWKVIGLDVDASKL